MPVTAPTTWVVPATASSEVASSMASTVRPSLKRRRSARRSSAVAYRWSGFLAMAFRMMASKVGGIDGLSSRGAGGWSRTCLDATATGVSPRKGGRPVAISKRTTPSE